MSIAELFVLSLFLVSIFIVLFAKLSHSNFQPNANGYLSKTIKKGDFIVLGCNETVQKLSLRAPMSFGLLLNFREIESRQLSDMHVIEVENVERGRYLIELNRVSPYAVIALDGRVDSYFLRISPGYITWGKALFIAIVVAIVGIAAITQFI